MSFAFAPHPAHIVVAVTQGTDLRNPKHENSIAHEATHGYLLYKLGYSQVGLKHNAKGNEIRHVNLLLTMIDDIVVNKIIQEDGFSPFAPSYLPMIEKETKAARKVRDSVYDTFKDDPLFKDRFMVFRHVMVWGFMEYFNLEPFTRRTIKKFLRTFQKCFPRQFTMANQSREVILQHDIFKPDGHRKTIEIVLKLWSLVERRSGLGQGNGFVNFGRCAHKNFSI
jgi:hypothetical protein